MSKKKLFKKDMILRVIGGHYYVFKVYSRLDEKVYHAHSEDGKIVMSRMHEEISPDMARQYLEGMRENIREKMGDEEAEKAFEYYIKEFNLIEKESSVEGEVIEAEFDSHIEDAKTD